MRPVSNNCYKNFAYMYDMIRFQVLHVQIVLCVHVLIIKQRPWEEAERDFSSVVERPLMV